MLTTFAAVAAEEPMLNHEDLRRPTWRMFAAGTVADLILRVTRIRSAVGEAITTPNGQIVQVTNLSRDPVRALDRSRHPAHRLRPGRMSFR